MRVALNDVEVLVLDPYDPPAEIEVTNRIRIGENRLSLFAEGVAGPSAVGIALVIQPSSGKEQRLSSDGAWPGLESRGRIEATRWELNCLPEISPFAEYNQWKEALENPGAVSLSPLPPGFQLDTIRNAGKGDDSWVSLTFDARGRIFIGKEQKGILRLTLSESGSEVVAAETIEETLRECRGLAWSGDTLYAHANNDKALYALRDRNGDDRFGADEIVLIQATEGGTGHGRNALALGPDKHLHAIVGDDIAMPPGAMRKARPETGAPRELGHWIRASFREDGTVSWETMNRGLRNPYGIAFNRDGEPFTYDADNEGDVGLPFYRPTRINHLVSGANYGWHQERGNTRSFPVYAPDSVPGTYDVGRGSPTGVEFGTRSHFPQPWRDALFSLDWAYGRILAIHLTPHGAGYQARGEVFLEGRPLNVTDLEFDGDGAMWFVTGGRKTRSTLYRVRYTGDQKTEPPGPGVQELERGLYSKSARELRHRLERFHGVSDPAAVDEAWPHLESPDPWIRNAARVALEWQPVETWRDNALDPKQGGPTALLALVRAGGATDRADASRAAAAISLTNTSTRLKKLTILRIHELAGPAVAPSDPSAVAAQIAGLRSDPTPAVQRELAKALIRLAAPGAVSYAMDRLASSTDQMDRLHSLETLAEATSGWETGQREVFFSALFHARHSSYGDRFLQPFFQTLEEGALSRVLDETERARLAEIGKAGPASEEPPPSARSVVKHWKLADLAAPPEPRRAADLARGLALYSAVLCAKCHVCGVVGRPVGPDLTTVASRFSRIDLLESILNPSSVVAEIHRTFVVTRNDGSAVMGRIVHNDFRESKITLATNPFAPAELTTIPKAEIRSWEESPVSPMPPSLLDTLSAEEVEDLLGFLISGGKKGG